MKKKKKNLKIYIKTMKMQQKSFPIVIYPVGNDTVNTPEIVM